MLHVRLTLPLSSAPFVLVVEYLFGPFFDVVDNLARHFCATVARFSSV